METKPYTVIACFDDEPANVHSLHVEGLDAYEAKEAAKKRLVLEAFGYDSEEEAKQADEEWDTAFQCEAVQILYTFDGHLHEAR